MKSVRLLLFGIFAVGAVPAMSQDTPDFRPMRDLRGHREAVRHLAFSPDGKFLVSAGQEGRLRLWNLETGQCVRQLFPREKTFEDRMPTTEIKRRIESVAFSPDGKSIAEIAIETSGLSILRLWNPQDGELLKTLAEGVDNMRALAFSPDGKLIATNARDPLGWGQKILVRDAHSGKIAAELKEQRLAATTLAFSPDGKILACAGARKIFIWDFEQKKLLHTIDAHKKAIQSIAFSPNGRLLVSGSTDDTIRVWMVESGKMTEEIEAEQDGVLCVVFSRNGKTIASGGKDKTIRLWKLDSGKLRARLFGHLERVYCLAVSPDGKTLASGSGDTLIALWDLAQLETLEADEDKDTDDEWKKDD